MPTNESNLSTPSGNEDKAPLPLHHRRALLGNKVDGQKNPNGAESASTEHRIGNSKVTY